MLYEVITWGMYNVGHQINQVLGSPDAATLTTLLDGNWRYWFADFLGANLGNQAGICSNILLGAMYFRNNFV